MEELSFKPSDRLEDVAKKLKSAATEGKSGPLRCCCDVIALAEQWEAHEQEAGGISCTAWLRKISGQNYAWWATRAESVKKLGEWCRRQLDHDVAKWISRNVETRHIDQVCFMLRQEFKQNNNIPISLNAAKPKVNALLKRRAEPHECKSCKELRELLKKHGIVAEQ
jgi:hypothetical protein